MEPDIETVKKEFVNCLIQLRDSMVGVRSFVELTIQQMNALIAVTQTVGEVEEKQICCPHCSSPEKLDISGMGATEYQCKDCNKNYLLSEARHL